MTENVTKCPDDAAKTYEVDFDATPPTIRFRPCGFVSDREIDISTRYCRNCKVFIDDETYVR